MSETEPEPVTADGRCLCGKIRFQVEGQCFGILYCHCQRCRKHTGAALAGFMMFESGTISWSSERDSVGRYRTEATIRAFCRNCGSSVPTPHDDETRLQNVLAGNILEMRPLANSWHVFTGSGCPWYVVPPNLPQWQTVAPELADLDPGLGMLQRHLEPDRITGSCLCGAVAFAAPSPIMMMNCHCSRCRLSRASAHATNLFVAANDFEWLAGEDRIQAFRVPDAERFAAAFCEDCGSLVPREAGNRINIPAGCLDSDPGIAPRGHIFCGSKAPWFSIGDELPQWEERPE